MALDQNLFEEIKAESANLGFDLFGVSTPFALEKTNRYKDWLDRGCHGTMGFLARPDSIAKRFSPTLLVKDCHTIISLGFSYSLIDFPEFPESATSGWISSFAISDDYHVILSGLAEQLVAIIRGMVCGNHSFWVFTDSAPLLEREFGVLGNMGWIGKNANLISPTVGSHFLLAEILTDLDMDSELARIPDRCGECHRCIDACPTKCIQPDRMVDARQCISYLTIENKGKIPIDLREKIGHWVFGCDICQMVCPWNHHSGKKGEIKNKNKIPSMVPLAEQLRFSEEEFKEYYSGTPVLRASWLGFTRNLIIATGNLKDPEMLYPLFHILKIHPSSMLRSHAAWALGKLGTAASRSALISTLETETDAIVIRELQTALD